jgi:hypothetical protein
MGGLHSRDRGKLFGAAATAWNVSLALIAGMVWRRRSGVAASSRRMMDATTLLMSAVATVSSLAPGWVGWHGREALIITNSCLSLQAFLSLRNRDVEISTPLLTILMLSSAATSLGLLSASVIARNDPPFEISTYFDELDQLTYQSPPPTPSAADHEDNDTAVI